MDTWHWLAIYTDGDLFPEYEEGGRQHGFGQVDRDRLKAIAWVPSDPDSGHAQVIVDIEPGDAPLLFRRRRRKVSLATGHVVGTTVIHYIGKERTLPDGGSVKSFVRLYDDGSIRLTDHDDDDDTQD